MFIRNTSFGIFQGPDPGANQEGEDIEPDPGQDEAGVLLGPDPGPNQGGEAIEPDPGQDEAGVLLAPEVQDRSEQGLDPAPLPDAAARKDETIRRLREEKKALSLELLLTKRKLDGRNRAVERSSTMVEEERNRATKLKHESAAQRSKASTMQDEVKKLAREAHRDKKAVREILIAKDEEMMKSSIRESNVAKASAIAQAQREKEEAAKRATAAEPALRAAEHSAAEEKATLLTKLNKECHGQEAVVSHLRQQLTQRSQSTKALKKKVAEQQKAVSAGMRNLKRTVQQHSDELRSAIERLRKRLGLKNKELHIDQIANEERLLDYII